MFNTLFNICLMIFVCYAVSGSAKKILFRNTKQKAKHRIHRRAYAASGTRRYTPKRQAKIIYLNRTSHTKKTARRNLRAA